MTLIFMIYTLLYEIVNRVLHFQKGGPVKRSKCVEIHLCQYNKKESGFMMGLIAKSEVEQNHPNGALR